MSSGVTVAYNGNVIHQMAGNGNFKMNTAGAYMEGDVDVVVDVSGGGGGTLITKNITENGVYNAIDDNADGYSQVNVAVSGGGATVLGYDDFDFSNTTTAVIGDSTSGWVLSKLDSPTASSGDEQIICTKTAIDLTNVDYIEFLFAWLKTNHSTAGGTVFGVSASVPQDYSTAKNESVKITKGNGNNQGSEPKTIPAFIDVLDVSSLTGSYYIWCACKVTFSNSGYIDTKFKVELN